jgi:hypothetical protein
MPQVKERICATFLYTVESTQVMTAKDERIGFRVSGQVKSALLRISKKEGRSLAQICELLLQGGIRAYEKEGSKYLQQLVEGRTTK